MNASRRRVHDLLLAESGGPAGHHVDAVIMGLIGVNVVAVVLETVDPIFAAYRSVFVAIEVVSVAAFTVEYVLRVWSCTVDPEYADPVFGRLRFAATPFLLVDLLAILPFYLSGLAVVAFADLRVLRALRLFRLLRVLKLSRYLDSLQTLVWVIERKKEDLLIAVSATTVMLLISSSLMFFAEHEAQPEAFPNIPSAMWWGAVTLTTVGYGDVYPVTPLGKLFGGVVAILGVGLFALPASILASGFVEEAQMSRRRCPHCGEELDRYS